MYSKKLELKLYRTYYRSRYSISAQVEQNRKPVQKPTDAVISAELVWGAAAYADRINGGVYRKEPQYVIKEDGTFDSDKVLPANKTLMREAIRNNGLITEADIEVGRQARDWLRKDLVVKSLKGQVSDFEKSITVVVGMDEFLTGADRFEMALVPSQIRSWREGQRMATVMEDVVNTPVAAVGEKVQLNVQVVKVVYSNNYNTYFITAKTDGHQMVFFSYREKLEIGVWAAIKGTVKAHRSDATQLNRVKVIK